MRRVCAHGQSHGWEPAVHPIGAFGCIPRSRCDGHGGGPASTEPVDRACFSQLRTALAPYRRPVTPRPKPVPFALLTAPQIPAVHPTLAGVPVYHLLAGTLKFWAEKAADHPPGGVVGRCGLNREAQSDVAEGGRLRLPAEVSGHSASRWAGRSTCGKWEMVTRCGGARRNSGGGGLSRTPGRTPART